MKPTLSRLPWCLLIVSLLFLPSAKAQDNPSRVSVVQSKMRFDFEPLVQFVLPLSNSSGKPYKGNVKLELLDSEDKVLSSANSEISIDPGNFLNNLVVGESGLPTKSPSELATYRLKYTVVPAGDSSFAPFEGIVQLGRIMTNPYQIRTSSLGQVRPGTKYPVRVRIENPYTAHPYAGIEVVASLKLQLSDFAGEEPKPILRKVKSDAEGYAVFWFDLPAGHKYDEGEITVSVRRGVLLEQETIDVKYPDEPRFSLMTDKSIYQPGQTVHMRVQAFGPDNHALSDGDVELAITDPENLNAFRVKVKTSQFGIASADWQIPSNLRLGEFTIDASLGTGDWYQSSEAEQKVKISRYDLPDFSVESTPDAQYYTAGRKAKVKVAARYLFGEPLKQGHVRIARVSSRGWNYSSQKYETEEQDLATGELSDEGTFTAEVSLQDDFEDFNKNSYEKFQDLKFAAYVTDGSTQRTEQRRFDVRITHQPIHIYMSQVFSPMGGPLAEIYITASYADGTPAPVDVAIEALKPREDVGFNEDEKHLLQGVPLKVVKTNGYGLVKVSDLAIPKQCRLPVPGIKGESAYLRLTARDSKGESGIESDYINFDYSTKYLRLRAEKTLYREGDDIHLQVESNLDDDRIIIEVAGESEALQSKVVALAGGRAKVDFAYDPRFHGELRILAYSMSTLSGDHPQGFVKCLYPAKQELGLALRMTHSSYKPGEQAVADFNLTTAQGSAVQGALGAVVFDKAVSERVRTDEDFGGRGFGFLDYQWYHIDPRTIAGISANDLLHWDSRRPYPDGLDLLAEALLAESQSPYSDFQGREDKIEIAGGENYFPNPATYFSKIIEKRLADVNPALESSYQKTGKYPYNLAELKSTLHASGVEFDALRDPWDLPYQAVFSADRNQDVLELKSAGPDQLRSTSDDFVVMTVRRPNYLVALLDDAYRNSEEYPHNLEELRATLRAKGVDFDALRDPWGTPYEAVFSVQQQFDVLELRSAGPDGQRGTQDDFLVATVRRPYFGKIAHAIDRVTQSYFTRTGKYIRDYETLRKELLKEKIDLDGLRDPWGKQHRYDFRVDANFFAIQVISAGPDGLFSTEEKPSPDDLLVCYSRLQYFQHESAAIDTALAEHFLKTGVFPATKEQLQPVLDAAKLSPEDLQDPWGRPYYFTFNEGAFYANSVRIKTYSVYPDRPRRVTQATPVTQHVAYVHVMSNGASADAETPFSVADFSGVVAEQTSHDLMPAAATDRTSLTSGTGGIKGQVTDPSGAAVGGVKVQTRWQEGSPSYETTSGADGTYILRNMRAGLFEVHFTQTGFSEAVVARVPVRATEVTSLDVTLNIAENLQVVEVMASLAILQTTSADVGCQTCETVEVSAENATVTSAKNKAGQESPIFTPRVRQYFPETLLWSPETVTDAQGHAQLRFKLADNITTWTMSVIASTLDGHVGTAQKDISAFQPFFVEHDPPKILTQGDVISLPVVLRNYLKEPQSLNVEMKPANWFSLLSAQAQKITIPAGSSADAIFALRADSSTKAGKQRVVASNKETGDAIERVVVVRPDGEEISKSIVDLLGGDQSKVDFDISQHAIRGSSEALLKLYPNLMAHVLESVQGIASRPAGCAEQVASTTLASLRALRILQKAGQDDPAKPGNPNAAVARHAREYVREGYERLLSYRESDGGFSYWGKGGSDLAITGHVLRTLIDSKAYIEVDQKLIEGARDFIIKQQQPDGSWQTISWRDNKPKPDATLTAYLARVLATTNLSDGSTGSKTVTANVEKALHFLEARLDEWKESYLVANYALAAIATGRSDFQEKARQQLLSIAHEEGSATYWNVELNPTPFYGWGRAGRLETTALAVEALSMLPASADVDGQTAKQAHRGLLFLLQGKDRYGTWSSTAATVNVIDAIVSAMPKGEIPGGSSTATVWLNGQQISSVRIPASSEVTGPVLVEMPGTLQNGRNQIEIRRPQDTSPLMTQVVSSEYVPWDSSAGNRDSNVKLGETRALRLDVRFDNTKAKVGDAVRCTVKAERIGFMGYGMMLAEIGLPPGVDVDRASLDAALESEGYGSGRYDVLPDRIVFYVWPKAGGTEFSFSFRPRFRMEANTTPSLLYDYYNPEARSVVMPVKFIIN
jgi:A-macroglobulin complement component/alpha-2-macroglobulin family protein/MG2 domain-containing protein/carboxypeptidase family protein/A-macroglobulin receptor/macroglobulin-like protein